MQIRQKVVDNANDLPDDLYKEWGKDGFWNPCSEKYEEMTNVNTVDEGLNAFEKYKEFHDHICTWKTSSKKAVFLPCASKKPIGSSTIHKKKVRAIQNSVLNVDVIIISEPCTVIPPEYRLSLPAINYDFPPNVTEKSSELQKILARRIAEWLDAVGYDDVFPYLTKSHSYIFEDAVKLSESSPNMYTIPSASWNKESDSYTSDMMKKQHQIQKKINAICEIKLGFETELPTAYRDFYKSKF